MNKLIHLCNIYFHKKKKQFRKILTFNAPLNQFHLWKTQQKKWNYQKKFKKLYQSVSLISDNAKYLFAGLMVFNGPLEKTLHLKYSMKQVSNFNNWNLTWIRWLHWFYLSSGNEKNFLIFLMNRVKRKLNFTKLKIVEFTNE